MMCACEEDFARQYFSHQLSFGTELNTQEQIPVTLGFQKDICNACRGLPEEAHPKAPLYGRTSKIVRYYWREIIFGTISKFNIWAKTQGYSDWYKAQFEHQDVYSSIEKEVIKEIKELHQRSPKYVYSEESQEEVLTKYDVEIVKLEGIYKKQKNGIKIIDGETPFTPEEFVAHHFTKLGYKALFSESIPFHTIFGIFLWPLIQDPNDPNVRLITFGDRIAFESKEKGKLISTLLPTDFGTSSYAIRRADAIERHFSTLPKSKDELMKVFDYWIKPSDSLRQYLWAHRPEDIAKAYEIASVLPIDAIVRILRYLLGNYWHRYCGWPDLLIYREDNFFFAEVKSSNDRLSENQKNWLRGNSTELHFIFKFIKIHKKVRVE